MGILLAALFEWKTTLNCCHSKASIVVMAKMTIYEFTFAVSALIVETPLWNISVSWKPALFIFLVSAGGRKLMKRICVSVCLSVS